MDGELFCPTCGRPTADPSEVRPGLYRNDGSDTMKAAAQRVAPRTGTQRGRVLNFVLQHPVTDDQIETVLRMAHQTASARRNELVADGYLKDSGLRRQTRNGADAIVWEATPLARDWWQANS